VYVERNFGVPFLSGTNIVQIKPQDLKYISKKVTVDLDDCLIHEGWILLTRSGTAGKVALVPSRWDGYAASEHVIRMIPIGREVHRGYLAAFLQTEYGHLQIVSKIFGGVVDELAEDDLKDILVPKPSWSIQEKIGEPVVEAYELKEKANDLETFTIQLLEELIREGKKADPKSYLNTFEVIGNEELDVIQGITEERRSQLFSWED
jgi:type I restriction enzyme S subunit